MPVVHNVPPAGHNRPATSLHVARHVQKDNEYFRYGTYIKSAVTHTSNSTTSD